MESLTLTNVSSTLSLIASTPQLEVSTPLWVGYIALFIGAILFGTNLAPIKEFEIGDGILEYF